MGTKIDNVDTSLLRLVCPGHASAVGYVGLFDGVR